MNFSAEVSYREWLRNICKAQDEQGALPGIIPTGGWGFSWGNGPAWDSVLAYLPYFVYIYRGETDMIKESAAAFMAYLHYLTTRTDENGLIQIGLGDWCHVGGIPPKAPLILTDSIMSMDIANKMSVMFDAVGMVSERAFAKKIASGYREAIRKHLIDFNTMTAEGNCQSSQAMCLYYGVFEKEEEPMALQRLLALIHDEDDHMDVGVLGGRVIFHVLSKYGYSDLAYKMIIGPDFPSYGYLIEKGATTLWESFFPDDRRASLNHHFWGDISAWFIKCLAGIRFNPQGNDITSVDIRPSFVEALDHAEGYYTAPMGKILSSWKKTEDGVILALQIPEAMKATAYLEKGFVFADGSSVKTVSSGEYKIFKN